MAKLSFFLKFFVSLRNPGGTPAPHNSPVVIAHLALTLVSAFVYLFALSTLALLAWIHSTSCSCSLDILLRIFLQLFVTQVFGTGLLIVLLMVSGYPSSNFPTNIVTQVSELDCSSTVPI